MERLLRFYLFFMFFFLPGIVMALSLAEVPFMRFQEYALRMRLSEEIEEDSVTMRR